MKKRQKDTGRQLADKSGSSDQEKVSADRFEADAAVLVQLQRVPMVNQL